MAATLSEPAAAKTAVFRHDDCGLHRMGEGHPECPERMTAIEAALAAPEIAAVVEMVEAPLATLDQIKRAHDARYAEALHAAMARCEEDGVSRAIDADTSISPGTRRAVMRAAGAAVGATDAVLSGRFRHAFCAVRPPGHHAPRNAAMGFCFFDSVAVGAKHALDAHGLERVAIIDFDVHHGNGTEDIVAADPRLFMASFFQHPLYPGSGIDPLGENMINVPVPPYTRSPEIRRVVDEEWMPRLDAFRPQMVFVSAGFDAHREDPLAQLGLIEADFAWITRRIVELADRHAQGRIVSCLEGGYHLAALGRSAAAHVRTLAEVAPD